MSRIADTLPRPGLPSPSAALELLKPITWFPPMWAFACGVISSGASFSENWPFALTGIILAGPMLCATSQAVNDWFDRHVDAINEPNRPIPSGRIPGRWGLYIALIWTCLSLLLASALGSLVFAAACIGMALAWAYSAPPFRLKLNGWWGNSAVAISYEGIAWFTGAAAMTIAAADIWPSWQIVAVAALYSFGAHGIMTLNDFKALEGDLKLGIRSLPAQLGVVRATKVACVMMAAPQFVVVYLLYDWGQWIHSGIVAVMLLAQIALMVRLFARPRDLAPWYNATGVSLYVLGMMVTAFALRGLV